MIPRQKEILDGMIAPIQDQKTVEDGVGQLAQSIQWQINQVFQGVILPGPIRDQVTAVFEAVIDNKGKIAAVLLANTPNVHQRELPPPHSESIAIEDPQPEPEPIPPVLNEDSSPAPTNENALAAGGAQGEATRAG